MKKTLIAVLIACGIAGAFTVFAMTRDKSNHATPADQTAREASRQHELRCTPQLSDTPAESREREAADCGTGFAAMRP